MTHSGGKGNKQPAMESVYTDVGPTHFSEAFSQVGKERSQDNFAVMSFRRVGLSLAQCD